MFHYYIRTGMDCQANRDTLLSLMAGLDLLTEGEIIVEAPRQHNHHDENEDIKQGKTPEEWKKPENIHKLRQKDMNTRWTRKGKEFHFG